MVGEACLRRNLKFHTRLITPFPVGFEYSDLLIDLRDRSMAWVSCPHTSH